MKNTTIFEVLTLEKIEQLVNQELSHLQFEGVHLSSDITIEGHWFNFYVHIADANANSRDSEEQDKVLDEILGSLEARFGIIAHHTDSGSIYYSEDDLYKVLSVVFSVSVQGLFVKGDDIYVTKKNTEYTGWARLLEEIIVDTIIPNEVNEEHEGPSEEVLDKVTSDVIESLSSCYEVTKLDDELNSIISCEYHKQLEKYL